MATQEQKGIYKYFNQEQRYWFSLWAMVCVTLIIIISMIIGSNNHRIDLNYELLSGKIKSSERYVGDEVENGPID